MSKREKITVESEIARLTALYAGLPRNKMEVVEGLIEQAARLRVRLGELWADIQENGDVEMFSQSDRQDPYQRERPQARLFTQTDKNYHAIIKTLADMLPAGAGSSKLDEFLNDDE